MAKETQLLVIHHFNGSLASVGKQKMKIACAHWHLITLIYYLSRVYFSAFIIILYS